MKTRLITLGVLLVISIILYASEDPGEQSDYVRKTKELKNLAERFKAETGFGGTIEYDYNTMKLKNFRGYFSDIHFPAGPDTTALRIAFDQALEKLMPYISASRSQLNQTGIYLNRWGNGTKYIQMVNGYPIESGGYLNITYTADQNRIDVLDETVDIPLQPLGKIISEEEAFKIARTDFEKTDFCNTNTPPWRSRKSIIYRNRVINGVPGPYRLYWKIAFPELIYYVDAITSEFYSEQYVITDNFTY